MKFDVYCDEAYPDLFSSGVPPARYLVIGSIWMPADARADVKHAIQLLRNQHRIGPEFKWQKIAPSKQDFYLELVELFFGFGDRLRFRCIAVDHTQVDLFRFHESDHELGFYKFYYQMLHHWILDFNEYSIFCDVKTNRLPDRLETLARCLAHANLSSGITRVQAIPSGESLGIQLADVLTGASAARLNDRLRPGGAKHTVVRAIEQHLGRTIERTSRGENKFNVFVIDLQGGW
jgi:hypothetical protein